MKQIHKLMRAQFARMYSSLFSMDDVSYDAETNTLRLGANVKARPFDGKLYEKLYDQYCAKLRYVKRGEFN